MAGRSPPANCTHPKCGDVAALKLRGLASAIGAAHLLGKRGRGSTWRVGGGSGGGKHSRHFKAALLGACNPIAQCKVQGKHSGQGPRPNHLAALSGKVLNYKLAQIAAGTRDQHRGRRHRCCSR